LYRRAEEGRGEEKMFRGQEQEAGADGRKNAFSIFHFSFFIASYE
jgi:hypothetical protein